MSWLDIRAFLWEIEWQAGTLIDLWIVFTLTVCAIILGLIYYEIRRRR